MHGEYIHWILIHEPRYSPTIFQSMAFSSTTATHTKPHRASWPYFLEHSRQHTIACHNSIALRYRSSNPSPYSIPIEVNLRKRKNDFGLRAHSDYDNSVKPWKAINRESHSHLCFCTPVNTLQKYPVGFFTMANKHGDKNCPSSRTS